PACARSSRPIVPFASSPRRELGTRRWRPSSRPARTSPCSTSTCPAPTGSTWRAPYGVGGRAPARVSLHLAKAPGFSTRPVVAGESAGPDIAVLDIDMPGRDGLDVARTLRDRRLATRVIFLTLHKDAWFLNAALDAGVHGYVPKESAATEIAGAIRSVHAGQ